MTTLIAAMILTHAVFDLAPAPQKIYVDEKKLFALEGTLPLVLEDNANAADMATLAPLYDALGFKPQVVPASTYDIGKRAIYIGIAGQNAAFKHRSLREYVPDQAQWGEEAYRLHVGRNGIVIAGAGRVGMIHGIYTLLQLIEASQKSDLKSKGIPALPFTDITDYPDLALRGVCVRGPLTNSQIAAFARAKCNMIIFESEDYYDLTPDKAALWRDIFGELRNAGITPVPTFEFFNVPDVLLRKAPSSVEGRSRVDRVTLSNEDFCPLTRRHIILTEENPLRLSADGAPLHFRKDFLVSRGSIEPPYRTEYAEPWMVRRIPGSALPGNSTVEITYSYAPPGSNALCPNAPETLALLKNTLKPLLESLRPEYIHGGFGDISRINQDLRCRDTQKTNADQYATAVAMMQGVITETNPSTRMMIWADALLPSKESAADSLSLSGALNRLPGDLVVVPRLEGDTFSPGGKGEAIVSWMTGRGMKPFMATSGSTAVLYQAVQHLSSLDGTEAGILLLDADPGKGETKLLFDKAWSRSAPVFPWPEVWNPFFGSDLLAPDFEAIKDVLWIFTERRILSGTVPEEIWSDFERYAAQHAVILKNYKEETDRIASFLRLLTRFLSLEHAYNAETKPSLLKDLAGLVKEYGELDADIDQDRITQIQTTIKSQSLFVPASILFGRSLAYYRSVKIPAGAEPCEAPAALEYSDTEGKTQATLDFLVTCGPVFRIDFETVNARDISLFASDDGVSYERITSMTSSTEGLRGPLLLAKPVNKRFLQIRIESFHGPAVLREVRAFFLKLSAETNCPMIADTAPASDKGQHVGMLYANPWQLAVAPTEIRVHRDSQSLYVHFLARDPLPHAMGAVMKESDAALWEEESVEVCVKSTQAYARRFVVNPLGTKHDAMAVASNIHNWDPGWDGDWEARTSTDENGWQALLRIPFALLGGSPKSGDIWEINFSRYRNNVEKETSKWRLDDVDGLMTYGLMKFE